MSRWPGTPRVELVTTDGFLYPNAELERRGLMEPQGLPRVVRPPRPASSFLTEVKSGAPEARAPFYSHMQYDIVPDAHVTVRRPDVVIVEGLNVLQPPPSPNDIAVSELFDFSIYVDADTDHIAQWLSTASWRCAGERSPTRTRSSTFRAPLRRGSSARSASGTNQPAEPRGERAADQAPGDPHPREGRRPHGGGCCCASSQVPLRGSEGGSLGWRHPVAPGDAWAVSLHLRAERPGDTHG